MKPISSMPEGGDALLHICCAPDAAYGVQEMQKRFRVTGFFFNPNLGDGEEHEKRLEATRQLQERIPFPLEAPGGGESEWEEAVRGLEDEPERGRRCEACIRMRLRRTASEAKRLGIPRFGTVLTVSPKKDAGMVNRIGLEEAKRSGVIFIESDMKKNDGFKKSVETSKRLGLYRQNFCGCRYSIRKDWRKREGIEPSGDISASRPDLKSGGATSAPSASLDGDPS